MALALLSLPPLTGYGKSSPTASGAATAATRTARAFASEVNLRAADVPGLVATKPLTEPTTTPGPLGSAVGSCAGGVVSAGEAMRAPSQRFRRNFVNGRGEHVTLSLFPLESAQSVVYVMASPASASREPASIDNARTRGCLERRLAAQRGGKEANELAFRQIAVAALSSPLRDVSSYWLRWNACSVAFLPSCTRGHSEQVEDYLGFVVESALITLHATGVSHRFPTATERRLLFRLHSRAEAHTL